MEQVHSSTELLRVILDAKYEKSDLNKIMKNQCQHLTETQRNEFLELLKRPKELFYGTLGTWKTDPEESKLEEHARPIRSRPYPVPKVHKEMLKK